MVFRSTVPSELDGGMRRPSISTRVRLRAEAAQFEVGLAAAGGLFEVAVDARHELRQLVQQRLDRDRAGLASSASGPTVTIGLSAYSPSGRCASR